MAEWKLVKAPPEKTYLQASAFVRAYNDEPTEAVKTLVRAAMTMHGKPGLSVAESEHECLSDALDRLYALCPELFEGGNGDA